MFRIVKVQLVYFIVRLRARSEPFKVSVGIRCWASASASSAGPTTATVTGRKTRTAAIYSAGSVLLYGFELLTFKCKFRRNVVLIF